MSSHLVLSSRDDPGDTPRSRYSCGKPVTGNAEIETGTLDSPRGKLLREPNPSCALRRLCLLNKKERKSKMAQRDEMSDINFAARLTAGLKLSCLGIQTNPESHAVFLSCRDRASLLFASLSLFFSLFAFLGSGSPHLQEASFVITRVASEASVHSMNGCKLI